MDVLSIYKKDRQIYGAENKDIDNPNISNCNTVDHVSNDESAGTLETSDICIDIMPTEKIVKVAYESCTSCSICICDFEVDEEVRLLPDCGHIFHTQNVSVYVYSSIDRREIHFETSSLLLTVNDLNAVILFVSASLVSLTSSWSMPLA
jgi:hypothetical protein